MKKPILSLIFALLFLVSYCQTTTTITWGTINTAYQLSGSTGGIINGPSSSYVFTNGAQESAQTISNGEQLIFRVPVASANWLVGLSPLSTVTPDYIYSEDIAAPYTNSNTPFAVFIGLGGAYVKALEPPGFVGTAVSAANNDYIRIQYTGGQILYQKSSDAATWTTFYTSTRTPSGSYYVVFQGLTPNSGPSTVYKVGGSSQAAPTVSLVQGSQTITLPTSSTLLVGSASTAGTIASRSWSKLSGPAGGAIGTPAKDSTIISGLAQGTYVYRYSATDNLGQVSSVDATIVVLPTGGTSSNVTFSTYTTSDPEVASSDRGSYEWMYQELINIPMADGVTVRPDFYYRNHVWAYLEPTQNNYDWNLFDSDIKYAIDRGQTFSFGIMTLMPDGDLSTSVFNSGGYMAYPPYLHTLMQGEATKDWISTLPGVNTWVPNFNSPNYIARWGALNRAIKNHLDTTFYKGVRFRDVINTVDVRGYGSWGQWNMSNIINDTTNYPAGTQPTSASLISIMDSVALIFNNYRCVFNTEAIDARTFWNTWIAPEVGYHALTLQNGQGYMGIRLDAFGWFNITPNWMENNHGSYGGLNFATEAMNRWKVAPIKGEPGGPDRNGLADGFMSDLVRQTGFYHFNTMGNGNVDIPVNSTLATNVNAAVKIMGYRLQVESATVPSTATAGTSYSVTLNWRNAGVAPVYRKWYPVIELRQLNGTVVFRDTSVFEPKYFLPSTSTTAYTDTWTWPSNIANGTYTLNLIIRDSCGYRKPLSLTNKGRATDGSYLLQTVVFGGAANVPPVVNPFNSINVYLPTSSVTITGSATDADGTIASYAWTQVSGPNTATLSGAATASLTASGLIAGQYSFRLTATDNSGAQASSTAIVTVSAVSLSAGSPQTIQLPTSSTSLTATQTGLTSPAWTQVSGPSTATIGTPNNISTSVSNLIAGVYVFRVTMFSIGTPFTSDVQVTVLAAPVANIKPTANAGLDQNLVAPNNTSTTLVGSGTDPDGIVSSYQWSQNSGPNTANIVSRTSSTTSVTGLVAGTYVFTLFVVDNLGLASSPDTINVVVNPTAVQSVSAGSPQTIQLPTSTATLTATATSLLGSPVWSKVSGPTGGTITSPNSMTTTVTGLTAGTYVFRITMTYSATAYTSTVQITVIQAPVNQQPVANAGVDISIQYPAATSTTLNGFGTDADGFISAYQWVQLSGPNTSSITSPTSSSTSVTGLVAGTYKYALVVVDNNSYASAPDTVQVSVNSVVNQTPTASAGANQTIYTTTTTVVGSGSDPDGTIASYSWSKVSGIGGTISSPSSSSTTITGLSVGTYVFRLTVTDNLGASSSSDITITVSTSTGTTKYVKSVTESWNTSVSPSRRIATVTYTDNSVEVIELNTTGAYIVVIRQAYGYVDGQRRIIVYIRFSDGTKRVITKIVS